MSSRNPYRVLFLCTGNSARSILAEFILNHRSGGRFEAFSAGAHPTGIVNPHVLHILSEQYKINPGSARSKSWTEFEGQHFDFIITLCDKAKESCPAWPGRPITAHWGSPDPADAEGTEEQIRHRFDEVAAQIAGRIGLFTVFRDEQLDEMRIRDVANQFIIDTP